MNNDDIQGIYNQTKDLNSPKELDDLILNKIRNDYNQTIKPELEAKNSPVFLAIAASTVLAVALSVFMMSDDIETVKNPLEIAKINPKKGQQLPIETYYPFASKNEIVLMCGKLPNPKKDFKWENVEKNSRVSELPELTYPYDLKKQVKPNVLCKRLNPDADDNDNIEFSCGLVLSKQNRKSSKNKTSSLPKLNYPYELKKMPKANVFCKRVERDGDKLVCSLVPTKKNRKITQSKSKSNTSQLLELQYPHSVDKNLDAEALCKQILKNAE